MEHKVHQIWIGGALPARERGWVEAVKAAAEEAGWEHKLWELDEIRRRYGNESVMGVFERACRLDGAIVGGVVVSTLMADYYRWRILADEGGLYLDCDFEVSGGWPDMEKELHGRAIVLMEEFFKHAESTMLIGVGEKRAARIAADAAELRLLNKLAPKAKDFAARLVGLARRDEGRGGLVHEGIGPGWLRREVLPKWRRCGMKWGITSAAVAGHEQKGERGSSALLHVGTGGWHESKLGDMAQLWAERAEAATLHDEMLAPGCELLVLVCSCQGEEAAEKRRACRASWLKEVPEGVKYAFLVGGAAPRGERDVWGLACRDGYADLPEKIRAAFKRALKMDEWDWIYKCDDDSYCALARLKKKLETEYTEPRNIHSRKGRKPPHSAHGGAGYLISREMVVEVLLDKEYESVGLEDQQVTFAVQRAGGSVENDDRFEAFGKVWPRWDNEQISTHWIKPEQMADIQSRMSIE